MISEGLGVGMSTTWRGKGQRLGSQWWAQEVRGKVSGQWPPGGRTSESTPSGLVLRVQSPALVAGGVKGRRLLEHSWFWKHPKAECRGYDRAEACGGKG